MSHSEPLQEFPDFDENTQATIFYTTGTTGLPKGVYFSHRQIVLYTLSGLIALGGVSDHRRCGITQGIGQGGSATEN